MIIILIHHVSNGTLAVNVLNPKAIWMLTAHLMHTPDRSFDTRTWHQCQAHQSEDTAHVQLASPKRPPQGHPFHSKIDWASYNRAGQFVGYGSVIALAKE